jgi:hypothetical protein
MGLDLRWPIGIMFTTFGVILSVYGKISDPRLYEEHSLGININFGWGLVLIAFGCVMMLLAWRGMRKKS